MLLVKALVVIAFFMLVSGCGADENAAGPSPTPAPAPEKKPEAPAADDAEKPVFEETFDKGLEHWQPEGPHEVSVEDGRLIVKTTQDARNNGQYVWCRTSLPADFRIEFDVTPLSTSGFFLVFFNVKGTKGEDILGKEMFEDYMNWKTWKPYEDWDKYTSPPNRAAHHQGRIRGYHISYRRNENANCNCRRSPGLVLVKSNEVGALLPRDRTAHVVLTKVGGRITLTVDGREFMDYTDTGEVYTGGRFGFRNVYDAEAAYDNVNVFDLSKKPA